MIPAELEAAARKVQQAITDEGPAPGYHYQIMKCHRREWPTLWKALDELLFTLGKK